MSSRVFLWCFTGADSNIDAGKCQLWRLLKMKHDTDFCLAGMQRKPKHSAAQPNNRWHCEVWMTAAQRTKQKVHKMQTWTCASKDNSLLKSVSFSVKVLAHKGETFNESLIVTALQVQQFASCRISSGKMVEQRKLHKYTRETYIFRALLSVYHLTIWGNGFFPTAFTLIAFLDGDRQVHHPVSCLPSSSYVVYLVLFRPFSGQLI